MTCDAFICLVRIIVMERTRRSEEHTSELHHSQISYAVFCLKKKKTRLGMASSSACKPEPEARSSRRPWKASSSSSPDRDGRSWSILNTTSERKRPAPERRLFCMPGLGQSH